MVPYIGKMAVDQYGWLDPDTFRDGVALCQTIPGATAMQTAAYVGYRARGVAGAAASFIGFALPAFLLMVALSAFYVRSHSLPPVVAVFSGLQAIVVAIVANATVSFGKASIKNVPHVLIAIAAAGMFAAGVNPILVIFIAALVGEISWEKQSLPPRALNATAKPVSLRAVLIIGFAAAFGALVLFVTDQKLFALADIMFRIDLFAFGGGFASVPLMFHEIVEVRSWIDAQTFLNGIALGQITPGPIVITATFVGYILDGVKGAILATVSVFLPSFLIVNAVIPYFDRLKRSVYFARAVSGILCSFVGLLLAVTLRLGSSIPWDFPRGLLAGSAFIGLLLQVEIIWVVLAGIAVSLLWL
jgi:chromate transporter